MENTCSLFTNFECEFLKTYISCTGRRLKSNNFKTIWPIILKFSEVVTMLMFKKIMDGFSNILQTKHFRSFLPKANKWLPIKWLLWQQETAFL